MKLHPQDKKKKIIDLSNWVISSLNKLAKADGRSTKNYIERVVISHVMDNVSDKPKKQK